MKDDYYPDNSIKKQLFFEQFLQWFNIENTPYRIYHNTPYKRNKVDLYYFNGPGQSWNDMFYVYNEEDNVLSRVDYRDYCIENGYKTYTKNKKLYPYARDIILKKIIKWKLTN